MKNILFCVVFALLTCSLSAQTLSNKKEKFLDSENFIKPNFALGIPEESSGIKTENFTKNSDQLTEGSNVDNTFIISEATHSNITISKKDIGRIVIYVGLIKKNATTILDANTDKGKLTMKYLRKGSVVESSVFTFIQDEFMQFHEHTEKAGIDEVQLEFHSKFYDFTVNKLKVVSYNKNGVSHYEELEKWESQIFNWSEGKMDSIVTYKQFYEDEMDNISKMNGYLENLIVSDRFINIEKDKVSAFNPFNNDKFFKHYNDILEKSSNKDKVKYSDLADELKGNGFKKMANGIDNLLLGGKFGVAIDLLDDLFGSNFKIKDKEIVVFDGKYYQKKSKSDNRLVLKPISNNNQDELKKLKEENIGYKNYVDSMFSYLKADALAYKTIASDIAICKLIKQEFKVLLEDNLTELNKINNQTEPVSLKNDYTVIKVYVKFGNKLDSINLNDASKVLELKAVLRSQKLRFDDLKKRYSFIVSSIKTHYDDLYIKNPRKRIESLNRNNFISKSQKDDFKNSQDNLIKDYTAQNGVQYYLVKATKALE